ncbi:hypothetical protein DM860_007889 [Cuscuta australis]|uniref:Uncharacterized protein n=1 Tax=Cuscuta australis TaxID=267555 RepID=A0A328DWV9_9ASTE|nr:hypothetical protein DM860_007889 [Cuscuta australis]
MAEDATAKLELSNSCCVAWKERYAKLKEKYSKLEEGRNALRKGLSIYEQQISKIQSENLTLKKAYEGEKVRADNESHEKAKESALRASLESEVAGLKSNILLMQHNPSPASEGLVRENAQLQRFLSEKVTEVSRLKELLENERSRAEKNKAETERKKADELRKKLKTEKNKADEERRLVESEGKEAAENRPKLEAAMKEADEVKMKLALEHNPSPASEDFERVKAQLQGVLLEKDTEVSRLKELLESERFRADSEKKKAEAERKNADELRKKLKTEKNKADEERRLIESERKEAAENRLKLEAVMKEADEVKMKLSSSLASENLEREKAQLQGVLFEKDTEVFQLKELLENERSRADSEKKKAESERKKTDELRKKLKTEKIKADEERKVVESERKEAAENRLKLEAAMKDINEVKMKLALETSKVAEIKKTLDTEIQNRIIDRKQAESYILKAAEQSKLADTNMKIAMDEKRRAVDLSKQLDQYNKRIENLKKEIAELKSSRKSVDNLSDKKREAEEKLAHLKIIEQLEDQINVLEAYKKKAAEEKHRADQLSCELKDNKQRLGKLQKEIHALISSKSTAESALHSHDRSLKCQAAKISILEKQLKLEKMLVTHSEGVTELEKARNGILQEELLQLKQDFSQFSKRLNLLDDYFIGSGEGSHDMEKLELKSKQFDVNPYNMPSHLKDGLALLADNDETDSFRERIEGSAPLLNISGGNDTRSVSGINSELEPLLKGLNKKVLQSSAINSSSTSFSDRPLVGSQERHSSSATSDKFAEEKSNIEGTISRLPCNKEEKCNEGPAALVDNSVQCPVSDTPTKRRGWHQRKRNMSIDAIEPIYSSHSENKMLQQQVPSLYPVLENQIGKSARVETCLLPDAQGNICSSHARSYKKRKVSSEERLGCHGNYANQQKANLKGLSMKESDIHAKSNPALHLSKTAHNWKDRSDTLRDFELLVGDDYMKLLNLDNDLDEESYHLAVKMPLSPYLLEIKCQSIDDHVLHYSYDNDVLGELSHMKENLAPPQRFDVIDMEIYSNKAKLGTLGTAQNSLLEENNGHDDISSCLNGNGIDHSKISHDGISNAFGKTSCTVDALACENERSKISGGTRHPPFCSSIPKCCVVFSDNDKVESISRVYSATNDFMVKCSTVSSSNLFLKDIVVFISGAQDLSAKEKASVFLSGLLHYISETTKIGFCNDWDRDSVLLIASFAHHICTEPSDENTDVVLVESFNLRELLALLEDFILHREVLTFSDVCSGSEPLKKSIFNLCVNGNGVRLFSQEASINLLVAGGILLASFCAEVDYIGFICEASCNILRMLRSDTSFVLTILHIFAFVCGSKYFSIKQYCFVMAVVRSLVVFLEKLNPPDCGSCFTSLAAGLSNIWSGSNCPFLEGTSSMDGVASMLLDNLDSCVRSNARHKYLIEAIHPSIEEVCTESINSCAALREVAMSSSITDDNACFFVDILALVELVAFYMSWDWTAENIVCPLIKMVESCSVEHVPAAILVLLAQLGRFGVSAKGYEDCIIQNLRSQFLALLSKCDSKTVSLEIQFSIGITLLGLVSLNFEEVLESRAEVPGFGSQYQATVCLRKWFSVLSNENQLSFKHVVSSSKSLQKGHNPSCEMRT